MKVVRRPVHFPEGYLHVRLRPQESSGTIHAFPGLSSPPRSCEEAVPTIQSSIE